MSQVSARGIQLGIDAVTPANNFGFTVPNTQDGTLRLQRGNIGTPLSDILTVNADNTVTFNSTVQNSYGNQGAATMRNKLDNCVYQVNQRGVVSTTTNTTFPADRWVLNVSIITNQLLAAAQSTFGPPGLVGQMQLNTNIVYASPAATAYGGLFQSIEGLRINDLKWGTAGALPVTLSFYAYSTITGTFPVSVRNSNGLNSYVSTYTVTTPNVWTRYVITIPGETTGTWNSTNAAGMSVAFTVVCGTTFNAPSANTWQSGNYLSVAGTTNLMTTINNAIYLAGIQLEAGSNVTPFEILPYSIDLVRCQRYFEYIEGTTAPSQPQYLSYSYKVPKRAAPTVALASGSTGGANFDNGNSSLTRCRCPVAVVATSASDFLLSISAEI